MMAPRSRRRSAAGSQTTATDPASFSHTPRGQCFDSRRVVSTEIQTPLQTRMRPEPVSCLAQVRLPPPFLAGLSLRSGKRCSPSLSAKRLIYNNSLSIPAWCSRPPTPLVWRAECAHRLLGNLSSCWEGFFVGPGVGSSSRCRLFFFPLEAAAVVPGYPHVLITSGNRARLFFFFKLHPLFPPSELWTVRRTKQERVNFPSLFSPSHQQEITPGGKKTHTHTKAIRQHLLS